MLKRKLLSVVVIYAFLLPGLAFAQAPAVYTAPPEEIAKIKKEGMENSKVMETLSYLTDVIGGRLTNSPSMKRANEWTRDTMAKWGMQNAGLEAWGPFGRGWELKKFSAQVVSPQAVPVIAFPKAWAPSTKGVVTGDVILFNPQSDEDYAKFKGQLKGKIVMVSGTRELKADFDGMGKRLTDAELLKMANAPNPAMNPAQGRNFTPEMIQNFLKRAQDSAKRLNFLIEEGAAVMLDSSGNGSGGTIFVQGATVAQPIPNSIEEAFGGSNRLSPWNKAAESKMIPQVTLATEDYNRLVRMINFGEKVQMSVNVEVQYYDDDPMGYNTVAEIPGTDPTLKDEVVMLGGHLDSWHAGTGATDNAAGCAVTMEAARIIMASGLKPRRTIRVALWSGEEQGLNGSQGYVTQHFGEITGGTGGRLARMMGTAQGKPEMTTKPAYEKLSAYYNLDNGTGKIRGVYMQSNPYVEPIFRAWLMPFADMGASTLTMMNTGGTDHLPFDAIGLPGFQFIQDSVEYETRTHHSNQDVFDRIQADDMKQASTIIAAFVYQTAMMDGKIPRKPMR